MLNILSIMGMSKSRIGKKDMDNRKEKIKNLEKEIEEFEQVKKKYVACRKVQRKLIIDYLESIGFTVPPRGGCGHTTYGTGGKTPRFSKAYDLSNWMYIDVEKAGKKFLISLQPFDMDPSPRSKNYHVLMDRIGIYIYEPDSKKTADAIDRMFSTDIDLPMNEAKLEKLGCLLEKIIKCQKQIEQKMKKSKLRANMDTDEDLKVLVPVEKEKGLFLQILEMYVGN